ncbi:MAG: AhpC/TSA family protein [Bacteroidales bacterium]|jgi:thiol-disulfide isomerase/thioredoxin|nr:AhpC/TSA family protein [Bacteroidales bacterium]
MKQNICILAGLCLLYACSSHSGYIINGTIDNADEKTVYLESYQELTPVVFDSAVVKNGKFQLKGTVKCPDLCLLYIGNTGPVQFFIENSTINIAVAEDIRSSVITGSKENDLFTEFSRLIDNDYNVPIKKLNDDYMYLQLEREEIEGNTAKKDSLDAKLEVLLEQLKKIDQLRNECMSDFVKQHPDNVFSAFIIENTLTHYIEITEFEDIINAFDENHPSQWVQMAKAKLASGKRTETGQLFADFEMLTPENTTAKLSDYAGKGNYLLVDFWASWCRPCRIANPQLVEIYRKYKNKGFDVVGVSLDKNRGEWTKAIADDQLTWNHLSDLQFWDSKAAKLYSVNSIPYAILLDKEGKIIEKGIHFKELDAKLAELLK